MSPNNTFYAQAAMLHIFINVIAPESRWQHRLLEHLQSNPNVPAANMSFPED